MSMELDERCGKLGVWSDCRAKMNLRGLLVEIANIELCERQDDTHPSHAEDGTTALRPGGAGIDQLLNPTPYFA